MGYSNPNRIRKNLNGIWTEIYIHPKPKYLGIKHEWIPDPDPVGYEKLIMSLKKKNLNMVYFSIQCLTKHNS